MDFCSLTCRQKRATSVFVRVWELGTFVDVKSTAETICVMCISMCCECRSFKLEFNIFIIVCLELSQALATGSYSR